MKTKVLLKVVGLVAIQSQIIMMASASASIAWGTPQSNSISDITEPSKTLQRVIHGGQSISTHSTLANVMMPYFAVDAFEWVQDPLQILTDKQLSFLYQNVSGYNPFIIIENGTSGLLMGIWANDSNIRRSAHAHIRNTTVHLSQFDHSYNMPQKLHDWPRFGSQLHLRFGVFRWHRLFHDCKCIVSSWSHHLSELHDHFSEHCGSTGPVKFTCQKCLHCAGTGNGAIPCSQFLLSNYAIPLDYGTNTNLAIGLASRAYQAAWAALAEYFATSANATTVQIALPTLCAKVIHWRVYS